MKAHTSAFKENVKNFGRELDSKIIYTLNGEEIELGAENLNSVSPHYEADILKSVMRQLDIDSNVGIPLGTILNYSLGVKVDENAETGEAIYEYINYGNYVVYNSEKQEDTESYKITCYDKMLYSMVEYKAMEITYPITINNYIKAICSFLGLKFASDNVNYANKSKEIPFELYLDSDGNSLDYTFRDVLDEIAQVTASTICINEETDQLEIRYINETNDSIDGEYLKDINVKFGQIYGPVNSIVISRTEGNDSVYLRDEPSIEQNGLCEIKIKDNQILNFNNRSTYLPDILNKLDGLSYNLNDFSSTGICYYNLCDKYNVEIDENIYPCIMFNDGVSITQGLEENIHTDLPEEGETDYSKSDKTDIKINQTYLIVDKQNQKIESVITNVTQQNDKISQISQTVDEINSKISDIADITISGESEYAELNLNDINMSEPITIAVHPNSDNISYLYPSNGLYPKNNLYPKTRTIRFHNTKTDEIIDYILPVDLLFYDSNNYDEFYLDYDSGTCRVTKRVGYNVDGSTYVLQESVNIDFDYPTINLTDGDYNITILGYETAYIFVRLMAQNIYTTQFATKAEVNTQFQQTETEITLLATKKVNEDEIIAKINLSSEEATINANKISLAGKTINLTSDDIVINSQNFQVDKYGNITANNANLNGELSTYKNNRKAVYISEENVYFYHWQKSTEEKIGAVSSVVTTGTNYGGIMLYSIGSDTYVGIGYQEDESSTSISSVISYDLRTPNSTPYIINTADGKLFSDAGGIVVENGLIKSWSMNGVTGKLYLADSGSGKQVTITVKDGLITGWTV